LSLTISPAVMADQAPPRKPRFGRRQAFGLEVEGSPSDVCMPPASGNGISRRVSMKVLSAQEIDLVWRAAEARSIIDRRFPDGRRMLAVDHHDSLGYRITAPRYGRYVVSPDGSAIGCALQPSWRWQRLFFAQVLPLAAALRGLALFHASAVADAQGAVAFLAASGTGKTSVAAHLVARGATLLTDDIMAIEWRPDALLAHPGPALTNVAGDELRRMTRAGRRRLGSVIGRSDKLHLRSFPAPHPFPLRRMYFLDRRRTHGGLALDPIAPHDPRLLLSSAFLSYVTSKEHLVGHLESCAEMSKSVPLFRATIPAQVQARDVAAAIAAHSGMLLEEPR
jgi:hypothetical protein